jgi:MOSC domain-containing protein
VEAPTRDVRVSRISIAPVKGLALLHVGEVELGPSGVTENRRLHLVDAAGRFVNGKTSMRLSLVASRLDTDTATLSLEFPEGGVVTGTIELGEPIETVFFGRPASGRLVLGPWSAALSAWSGRSLRLVMSDEAGAATDRGPDAGVTIVSAASIADLARVGGVEVLDARRFRMLFEVAGAGAYEEDTWIGRHVRIGNAVVEPRGNVGRCVVTTCDPDTAERDFDTLGVLATYRRELETSEPLPLGVVGDVVTTGRVRVGDPVRPI